MSYLNWREARGRQSLFDVFNGGPQRCANVDEFCSGDQKSDWITVHSDNGIPGDCGLEKSRPATTIGI